MGALVVDTGAGVGLGAEVVGRGVGGGRRTGAGVVVDRATGVGVGNGVATGDGVTGADVMGGGVLVTTQFLGTGKEYTPTRLSSVGNVVDNADGVSSCCCSRRRLLLLLLTLEPAAVVVAAAAVYTQAPPHRCPWMQKHLCAVDASSSSCAFVAAWALAVMHRGRIMSKLVA